MKTRLLIILAILTLARGAAAGTFTAASLSPADMQTAANAVCACTDPVSTLWVPAGTNTWATNCIFAVTNQHVSISVFGSGTNRTVITNTQSENGNSGSGDMFEISVATNSFLRFSGFGLYGSNTVNGSQTAQGIVIWAGYVQVDNCHFEKFAGLCIETYGSWAGLVNNCSVVDCWAFYEHYAIGGAGLYQSGMGIAILSGHDERLGCGKLHLFLESRRLVLLGLVGSFFARGRVAYLLALQPADKLQQQPRLWTLLRFPRQSAASDQHHYWHRSVSLRRQQLQQRVPRHDPV